MKFDISHIATLANLPLSDEEKKKLEKQLEETLSYIANLKEVNTTGIDPTSQVTGLENVTREDRVEPSLSQKQALQNAKATEKGMFKVNAILEE